MTNASSIWSISLQSWKIPCYRVFESSLSSIMFSVLLALLPCPLPAHSYSPPVSLYVPSESVFQMKCLSTNPLLGRICVQFNQGKPLSASPDLSPTSPLLAFSPQLLQKSQAFWLWDLCTWCFFCLEDPSPPAPFWLAAAPSLFL